MNKVYIEIMLTFIAGFLIFILIELYSFHDDFSHEYRPEKHYHSTIDAPVAAGGKIVFIDQDCDQPDELGDHDE